MLNPSPLRPEREVTGSTPILTRSVAKQIIDRVSAGLSLSVSVTTATAEVIASTDPHLVGEHLSDVAALLAGAACGESGAGQRLIYADRTVGAIVLHETDPDSPLLQVARTLAELIIHQLAVLDQLPQRRWARDSFLNDLLHNRLSGSADAILHQAAILGIDLSPPRMVALIDLTGLKPPSVPSAASMLRTIDRRRRVEREHARLVELAHTLVANQDRDLCACLGERWLAILPALPDEAVRSDCALLEQLDLLLNELAVHRQFATWAGLGRRCSDWTDLPYSFHDACFALEVGPSLGGAERVFTVESLGLAGLICHTDTAAKQALGEQLLAPLADEPELLATLAAFLHMDLAPSQAARALSIHRHTLSYRLDKIAALTGRDPRRFRDAAQLYAALLLQRVGSERRNER